MALQRYPLNRFDTSIAGAGASYFIGDAFGDLPTSGLRVGDLGYDIATGKLYVANSSTTFAEKGAAGAAGAAGPPGSGGINTVKTYGALGNDSANDTAAFVSAIANERIVYVPPGIYRVGQLTPQAGQRFVGLAGHMNPGATPDTTSQAYIRPRANSQVIFEIGTIGSAIVQNSPTFENIQFTAGSFTGCTAIRARNANRLRVHECSFIGFTNGMWLETGANINGADDNAWQYFTGNVFKNCTTGVYVPQTYGFTMMGGDMVGGTYGVDLHSYVGGAASQQAHLYGIKFVGLSGAGIRDGGGINNFESLDFENCVIGIDLWKESTNSTSGRGRYIAGCNFAESQGNPVTAGIRVQSGCTNTAIVSPLYIGTMSNTLLDSGTGTTTLAAR